MNSPAHTLTRSHEHRMIAGVVGGIAEYSGLSPVLLRALFVLVSLASAAFPGVVVYLLLWAVLPKAARRPHVGHRAHATPASAWEFDPSLDLPDS